MPSQGVRAHVHHQRFLESSSRPPRQLMRSTRPIGAGAQPELPGTLIYLECLDLDLLREVAGRLALWSGGRGWKVTTSQVTLNAGSPLAWPVLDREADWIEAHRRDLEHRPELPSGTLHLQCSGWLRTLACLRARGQTARAEAMERMGAELPYPDQTFMLVGPFSEIRDLGFATVDVDQQWSILGRAFERKVAFELESAARTLLEARTIEGNPGWSAAHYSLQIQSLLERAWRS